MFVIGEENYTSVTFRIKEVIIKMTRIAHVINKLDGGGAERLLSQLLPILSKNLHVDLIVFNQKSKEFSSVFEKNNIRIISLTRSESVYSPFHILRLCKYIHKYDIVHVHLFPAQYWVAIASIFVRKKVLFVTTEHNTYNTRMKYAFLSDIEKLIYSRYSKIISVSLETQRAIIEWLGYGMGKSKFSMIKNGIEISLFSDALKIPVTKISPQLNGEEKLLIQVARFNEQKDQATAIRAMLYLPDDYTLLLVGKGPLLNYHQKLVEEYQLESRVIFLGYRTDVANLVKSSYISIVSSHWEGFGLVAIEAMAAAIPVVASNVEGLNSVVDGAGLLFKAGDEYALAEKIILIGQDVKKRKEIILQQKQRIVEYNIERTAQEHIELYSSLTNYDK
jgi:glycosyltransferase involved in cell wall biosynthesis